MSLLDRPLVPVADPEDATETYEELRPYLLEVDRVPIVVHVIEKAGGAPDKAGVEQRREYAEEAFAAFRRRAETDGIEVKTKIRFGTDVAESILDVAELVDATAIVFRTRGEFGWLDRITGRVRSNLITESRIPVVVLPSRGGNDAETGT